MITSFLSIDSLTTHSYSFTQVIKKISCWSARNMRTFPPPMNRVIKQDLGDYPENIFKDFQHKPIASGVV